MTDKLAGLVHHLENASLTWMVATLAAYRLALVLYSKSDFNLIFHPVGMSVVLVILGLTLTGTSYQRYFSGTQLIHLLLGPATVALAIPLFQQAKTIKKNWGPILVAAMVGSVVCTISAMGIAWSLGASDITILALGAKSVTMPIAVGMAEQLHGSPSLTAALVFITGITGTLITRPILERLNLLDARIYGFGLGTSAHGIGLIKALELGHQEGAYAILAMGLCGVLTASLLPLFQLFIS